MLNRRTPMKRNAWPSRPALERTPPVVRPLSRRGAYDRVDDMPAPIPRTERKRNPTLLGLAQGRPCLLRIGGVCNRDPETTVACHSNWQEHGKAGARKADDHRTVWGCSACHHWFDRGPAPEAVKRTAFANAHAEQVLHWAYLASSHHRPEAQAARWALDLLGVAHG